LTARIFDLLESELGRHLVASFTLHEPEDGSAASVRSPGRLVVDVRISNHSALPLKDVRGVIAPAPRARFRPTPFALSRLMPRQVRIVATIEVGWIGDRARALDELGHVSLRAAADLSDLQYQAWDRPLVHEVASRSAVDDPRRASGPAALPVSPGDATPVH
jgi:hypothetical protein